MVSKRVQWAIGSLAVIALSIGAIAGYQSWRARQFDRQKRTALRAAADARTSRDSVNAVIMEYKRGADAHRVTVDSLSAVAAAHAARERVMQRHFERLRDSFAVLDAPSPADSVKYLTDVVVAKDEQIAQLRIMRSRDSVALAEAHNEARKLRAAVDTALWHLTREARVRQQLEATLARAEAPCRILWMGCPSRRTTLTIGLVAGVVGGVAAAAKLE